MSRLDGQFVTGSLNLWDWVSRANGRTTYYYLPGNNSSWLLQRSSGVFVISKRRQMRRTHGGGKCLISQLYLRAVCWAGSWRSLIESAHRCRPRERTPRTEMIKKEKGNLEDDQSDTLDELWMTINAAVDTVIISRCSPSKKKPFSQEMDLKILCLSWCLKMSRVVEKLLLTYLWNRCHQ
jgi:hypothetical protein